MTAFADALSKIDWQSNTASLSNALGEKLDVPLQRFAVWVTQLERSSPKNPAVSFLREARLQSIYSTYLTALAFYKPAAASMRTVVECTLYYSYFCTHPTELATLVRDKDYYTSKAEIISYHKIHTPNFAQRQAIFGMLGNLDEWYSNISAIIHGQLPGQWVHPGDPLKIAPSQALTATVVDCFLRCMDLTESILFVITPLASWRSFEKSAKQTLLKGMHGDKKSALNLSVA